MNDSQTRISAIEERNRKVELDKAWELSLTRKAIISVLTYVVVVLFFLSAGLSRPFTSALIPTIGFILSTLSLSYFKKIWIKQQR